MGVLISAIIPVYNSEEYLEECIKSLINQSLKEIEMIFVNDGSTDKSLDILNKYKEIDKRIKIINQSNKGPSAARNLGIINSKGKYLSFVDADDWIDVDMYKEMYDVTVKRKLMRELHAPTIILGPTPSSVAKIKNQYYYQILVKYKYEPKLHDLLHQIQDDAQLAQKRGLNIYIDNEPERIM